VAELTPDGRAALADDGARVNDRQRGLLQTLAERGATVAAELDTAGLRRLESRGLVAIDRRARPRRPVRHEIGSASATAPPLTLEQSAALERLTGALRARPAEH